MPSDGIGGYALQKMGPLSAEHPLVSAGHECPICGRRFEAGEAVTLVPVGPDGPEDRRRAQHGRAHTAVANAVHWECV